MTVRSSTSLSPGVRRGTGRDERTPGPGADVFGTGSWTVPHWLSYHPTFLAELTGQLPLLAAMIAFTVGGLYLLFSS